MFLLDFFFLFAGSRVFRTISCGRVLLIIGEADTETTDVLFVKTFVKFVLVFLRVDIGDFNFFVIFFLIFPDPLLVVDSD